MVKCWYKAQLPFLIGSNNFLVEEKKMMESGKLLIIFTFLCIAFIINFFSSFAFYSGVFGGFIELFMICFA